MKDPADTVTVDLYGVKDGVEVKLGKIQTPPRMKAREIVQSFFGSIDEDLPDEGALALWAMYELIDWMKAQKK